MGTDRTDGQESPQMVDADSDAPTLADQLDYDDTGVGSTTAADCFPGGASPYGCRDMAGNVHHNEFQQSDA